MSYSAPKDWRGRIASGENPLQGKRIALISEYTGEEQNIESEDAYQALLQQLNMQGAQVIIQSPPLPHSWQEIGEKPTTSYDAKMPGRTILLERMRGGLDAVIFYKPAPLIKALRRNGKEITPNSKFNVEMLLNVGNILKTSDIPALILDEKSAKRIGKGAMDWLGEKNIHYISYDDNPQLQPQEIVAQLAEMLSAQQSLPHH